MNIWNEEQGLPEYVYREKRWLRRGYTTGTCAAAAAGGAAGMLLSGTIYEAVEISVPKGNRFCLPLEEACVGEDWASCGVRKDAGDDPDVTDGLLICARVSKREDGLVKVDGGEGIGRVTKAGLSMPPGEAAINPVPRRMIAQEAAKACRKYGYEGGLDIVIYVPGGEAAAGRTFNSALGIVGGISILGTTGIVEPMSEEALIESIRWEMRLYRENVGRFVLAVPGNYGEAFVREQGLALQTAPLKCSNYVGETIDCASELGMSGLLLVSHIGKFVKLAAGMMNTHSSYGDGRIEILCAHGILAGADAALARKVLSCVSADAALGYFREAGIQEEVMASVMRAAQGHLTRRAGDGLHVEAMTFSNVYGLLGKTSGADALLERIQEQNMRRGEGIGLDE